ncbi:hypothetical protein MAPG_08451 [Magnaporthiopsis poae ATCC 64411]|uniref:Uncharacterized protein n=1 Tax=Magnaporthiopsis poae (strain ATCC 64411 / 73-15) TaxID=644358 RepID=A0A0C4E7D8_MAGP6|nr:hypothetical protein MAPG_08451 [Magnaporthiopsis poae ATCC 64411]
MGHLLPPLNGPRNPSHGAALPALPAAAHGLRTRPGFNSYLALAGWALDGAGKTAPWNGMYTPGGLGPGVKANVAS